MYLLSTGFLTQEKDLYVISVPLLHEYAKTYFSEEMSLSITKQRDIIMNNTNITSVFSPSERKLLRYLIDNKGKVISRDEIAQAVWKEKSEEKYSDWAIDQLVRRVRQKIIKLGLPENTIVTKKNQGYIIAQ
jgi:DNA-binding response OmpR family regulator